MFEKRDGRNPRRGGRWWRLVFFFVGGMGQRPEWWVLCLDNWDSNVKVEVGR